MMTEKNTSHEKHVAGQQSSGNKVNPAQHAAAGQQSSGNKGNQAQHAEAGRKGGEASHSSSHK